VRRAPQRRTARVTAGEKEQQVADEDARETPARGDREARAPLRDEHSRADARQVFAHQRGGREREQEQRVGRV
jgi:hypothetical protein